MFDRKTLSLFAHGNGNALWFYRTSDGAAVVDTAGYFNQAADQRNVGDFIMAIVEDAGARKAGLFWVSANTGGIVDVNDMTAVGATDTD